MLNIQNNTHYKDTYIKYNKSPGVHKYGVTRGRLPQGAGLLGPNGGGTATVVPPYQERTGGMDIIQ